MKAFVLMLLVLFSASAFAGNWVSRFDGTTAKLFKVDPIPTATDEGLGAGTGAE